MFDEANNKKSANQEDKPTEPEIVKKDDVSDSSISEQDKESPSLPDKKEEKSVEDIFAETDKFNKEQSAKPPVFQPKQPTAPGAEDITDKEQPSGGSKKFIIIGAIALAVILLGFGSWYIYSKFFPISGEEFQAPADEQAQEPAEQPEEQEPVTESESQPVSQSEITPQPSVNLFLDSDHDGLTDEEEKQLGTAVDSLDTDKDKLFDREEVKVYKTDPLNPDTDGDGFLDGEEVKSGYNPKGEGRLYEIK